LSCKRQQITENKKPQFLKLRTVVKFLEGNCIEETESREYDRLNFYPSGLLVKLDPGNCSLTACF